MITLDWLQTFLLGDPSFHVCWFWALLGLGGAATGAAATGLGGAATGAAAAGAGTLAGGAAAAAPVAAAAAAPAAAAAVPAAAGAAVEAGAAAVPAAAAQAPAMIPATTAAAQTVPAASGVTSQLATPVQPVAAAAPQAVGSSSLGLHQFGTIQSQAPASFSAPSSVSGGYQPAVANFQGPSFQAPELGGSSLRGGSSPASTGSPTNERFTVRVNDWINKFKESPEFQLYQNIQQLSANGQGGQTSEFEPGTPPGDDFQQGPSQGAPSLQLSPSETSDFASSPSLGFGGGGGGGAPSSPAGPSRSSEIQKLVAELRLARNQRLF